MKSHVPEAGRGSSMHVHFVSSLQQQQRSSIAHKCIASFMEAYLDVCAENAGAEV